MRKKGQIWVETVIYTLIGLTLIGVVLAIATPKINQSRDKILVEQSITSLNSFDDKIKEAIDNGQGNRRIIREFSLKRGRFNIDAVSDEMSLILEDLTKPYSEPGQVIEIGDVLVRSEVENKQTKVYLILNYSGVVNLTFGGQDTLKEYSAASIPYSFIIDNEGDGGDNLFIINIGESSSG